MVRFHHVAMAGDVINVCMQVINIFFMQYSRLYIFDTLCLYDTAYISCVVTLHDMCVCVEISFCCIFNFIRLYT